MAPFPPQRRTILVVEDDLPTRELYRQALAVAGYDVMAVEDGLQALRTLEASTPDAVVLDVMLPRVGGLDVYAEMRSRDETSRIPVVIVTGTDMRALESDGLRQFLRKPIHPDQLVAAVDHAASRRRAGGAPTE